MGFEATKEVEELTYNFNPHVDLKGVVPEPSTKQVEKYRKAIVKSMVDSGINPESEITLDQMDDMMTKSTQIEERVIVATADLTGIAPTTLRALPYRVSRAFAGWIFGTFFHPEV